MSPVRGARLYRRRDSIDGTISRGATWAPYVSVVSTSDIEQLYRPVNARRWLSDNGGNDMTTAQTVILLIEVGVLAGVALLSFLMRR